MKDEILKHLYDITDAALAIKRFIEGKTFDDYKGDALLQSGVERKFEIVGECYTFIIIPIGVMLNIMSSNEK